MMDITSFLYAIGNVSSSVSLVLLNKRVFSSGFQYPMSLTFLHFVFTILFFQVLAWANFYSKPKHEMSQFEKSKVAFSGLASIGFMNLSLKYNSVGFYQITKLVLIPVTLVINAVGYGVTTSSKLKCSLVIILAGVGVSTVTDVELRPLGFAFGCGAVLATATFQIWQGTKQKEHGFSGTQLQAAIAPWQSAQALLVAALAEGHCGAGLPPPCETVVDYFGDYVEHTHTLVLVLGTCFLALMVNFTSFGLIGRTGPITFQVVGHAKTCLVLVGGYVLFPPKAQDMAQVYNNIAGVSVAFFGCVLYGNIKYAESHTKPDCIDLACPTCIVRVLDPTKYFDETEETEQTAMVPRTPK